MSANTDNSRDQTPHEVAELWAQLHDEAVRRRDALKPAASRRWIAIIIASAAVVVALISVGAVRAIQQGQRVSAVTATAVAAAAAETLAMEQAGSAARETRAATTATADWNALETSQTEAANITATAAVSATTVAATATQAAAGTATQVAGTATAEAVVAATKTAVAIECLKPDSYAVKVNPDPTITPAEGTEWITNQNFPFIEARWTVTNIGQCAWEQLVLEPWKGTTESFPQTEVSVDNPVKPGDTVQVAVRISGPPPPESPLDWEFFIDANNGFKLTGDKMALSVAQWIKPVAPTPTPTPTPTATPTPRVGNLVAREPQSQRYMSEGVVFEWTYNTMLENSFRFQILARGPGNVEYRLAVPTSCESYEPSGNNHRCTVRNGDLLPANGSYTWSVRVIDAADQVRTESNSLSFDLSRELPLPEPTITSTSPTTRTLGNIDFFLGPCVLDGTCGTKE